MSLIFSLPSILEESRREYCKIKESLESGPEFFPVEKIYHRKSEESSLLARGDNLDFIQYLLRGKKMEGKLQLAYLDPPFYSKASYDAVIWLKSEAVGEVPAIKPLAYEDLWKTGIEEYLRMLCVAVFLNSGSAF